MYYSLCWQENAEEKVSIEQHAGRLVDSFQEIECAQCENSVLPILLPESVYLYFFANMKKHYGWNWSEGDFKGFKGSLAGAMMECYKARRKEFVSKRKRRYFIYFAIFSKIHCLEKIRLWRKEKGVYCAGR